MAGRGSGVGAGDSSYTTQQIEAVLSQIGIEVQGETINDFICYCPFHGNRNSPSFSVSRIHGSYICFNPSCQLQGTLIELVKAVENCGEFQARRLIITRRSAGATSMEARVRKALHPVEPFQEFSQDKIDLMVKEFWENPEAVKYMMNERKFTEETLRKFKVGFSPKKKILAVPMYDIRGTPVGVIGRPIGKDNKAFKNSRLLPTSKTLWNIHRAKRCGETLIINESSFDSMRVDQSGYPNVVASLGGNFNQYHAEQIDRTFTTVVIMTDFDKRGDHIYPGCRKCIAAGLNLCEGHNPGRDLGRKIVTLLPRKKILWATFGEKEVYPHNAKDAGDMSDDEIRQCLRNATPDYIYRSWKLY